LLKAAFNALTHFPLGNPIDIS